MEGKPVSEDEIKAAAKLIFGLALVTRTSIKKMLECLDGTAFIEDDSGKIMEAIRTMKEEE